MEESQTQSTTLATKQDVLAIKQDIAALEIKLSKKIGGFGSEVVRWMFVFWLAQITVTFGGLLLFLKK